MAAKGTLAINAAKYQLKKKTERKIKIKPLYFCTGIGS